MNDFYSNGKLLLTAEYAVLDGAMALAVPTVKGQSLKLKPIADQKINWKSFNHQDKLWFENTFCIADIKNNKINDIKDPIAHTLARVLQEADKMNLSILQKSGFQVTTKLNFPIDWGLGSSSTLISNIANWFKIDPFLLLEKTFGGSGYDIACAQNDTPITFQLPERKITPVTFNPPFRQRLFFVHLNRKQNSRESIAHYKNINPTNKEKEIAKISEITSQIITCQELAKFRSLIDAHEEVISTFINLKTIKSTLFRDYSGSIKSLGGWGGDFILATGGTEERNYFRNKDYNCIVEYHEMVK